MRVLVIGGGVAGFMAALAAVEHGARARLISRAPGATALYAGGMEITAEIREVRALAAAQPYHPLARLGLNEFELVSLLDEVCARLKGALDRVGLPLMGSWRQTGWFADVHGGVRPAHLVPTTVSPGELTALQGRRVVVVGISAVGEYDALEVASALEEVGVRAVPVTVGMDLPAGASLTDLFGRPAPTIEEVADAIAFPPGLEDLPPNGFELLAAVPSPHGWRLQRALEAALEAAGVGFAHGEVDGVRTRGRRVEAVLTASHELQADRFVLATGRFLGGGLVKDREIREPIFDLGVFYEGRRVDQGWPLWLQHLESQSPAPAFRAGVLTDERLRPLDWEGRVAYENLHAAGSILGGYDYARGFGFGVPILTGWLAGRWAAIG
ncbi:MAG TPA: FAD-binding protein [Candidatus Dormibacteraeota bacterium]|nr:FAD-binding protein [Candidatus Dormibacteraeota bacterium]